MNKTPADWKSSKVDDGVERAVPSRADASFKERQEVERRSCAEASRNAEMSEVKCRFPSGES